MNKRAFVFLVWAFLGVWSLGVLGEEKPSYKLREGDALAISVWGDATLQKEVKVLPDGSVTFPLAGRVVVVGMSTPEVEAAIAEKLKKFLPEPQVNVVVTAIEGSRAYIVGKVGHPGPVPINSPMTVLQALSMAGGVDKFADAGSIKILRITSQGQTVIPVNFDKLLKGQALESNVELKAGDTILVP